MIEKLLHSKKIRLTDFRISLLHIFNQQDTALTMVEIEKELGSFDRITLYRTLKLFKDKGILHEIALAGNDVRLALCDQACEDIDHHHHNHIHFHCVKCGEVYCLEVDEFPQIGLTGFQVDQLEIQASGTCKNCS